jgi:3-deoxy-D-arabino-heptulosonate 7-phosphate (DAHP) synthase
VPSLACASFHINRGINQARAHVLHLNKRGLPTALEFRDTITPQFFADLLSFASVSGQDEALQELVSGLSMPVGVRVPVTAPFAAIKAIETSCGPHHFLGVSAEGVCGVVQSTGNPDVIAVLGAGQGEGGDAAGLTDAIMAVHRSRPASAIMAELGPDPLVGSASLEESIGAFCSQSVCAGGSLGSKIIGLHLRLHSPQTTAKTLSAMLGKLAAAVGQRRRSRVLRRPASAAAGTETDNLRIADVRPLLPPACLLEELARDKAAAQLVRAARTAVGDILSGTSDRLLVLAGPAVVDDPSAALEYGARLAALARDVADDVFLVMTVRDARARTLACNLTPHPPSALSPHP